MTGKLQTCLISVTAIGMTVLLLILAYPEATALTKTAVAISLLYFVLSLFGAIVYALINNSMALSLMEVKEYLKDDRYYLTQRVEELGAIVNDSRWLVSDLGNQMIGLREYLPPVTPRDLSSCIDGLLSQTQQYSNCPICNARIREEEEHSPDCAVSLLYLSKKHLEELLVAYPNLERDRPRVKLNQG